MNKKFFFNLFCLIFFVLSLIFPARSYAQQVCGGTKVGCPGECTLFPPSQCALETDCPNPVAAVCGFTQNACCKEPGPPEGSCEAYYLCNESGLGCGDNETGACPVGDLYCTGCYVRCGCGNETKFCHNHRAPPNTPTPTDVPGNYRHLVCNHTTFECERRACVPPEEPCDDECANDPVCQITPTPTPTVPTPTPTVTVPPSVTPTPTATPTPTITITPTPIAACDCDHIDVAGTVAPGETLTFTTWAKVTYNAKVDGIVYKIWRINQSNVPSVTPTDPPLETIIATLSGPIPITPPIQEHGYTFTDWYTGVASWTIPTDGTGFVAYWIHAEITSCSPRTQASANQCNTLAKTMVLGTTTQTKTSFFGKLLNFFSQIFGGRQIKTQEVPVPTLTPTPISIPAEITLIPTMPPIGGYCAANYLRPTGTSLQLGTWDPNCPTPTPVIAYSQTLCHDVVITIYYGE